MYLHCLRKVVGLSPWMKMEDVAREALVCDWKDYEDAVQHMSAIKVKADCMVKRNKKNFWKSVIPVYTIDELMSLM